MKPQTKLTRRIAIGTLSLLLLCGTALAAGTIRTQMIEANYMDIKVVVDGLEVTPKDATGRAVEPFASNGTTYLPVRAVAEALGKDVEWDGETKTVYIGDNIPGKETNWMTKLPPYQLNHAALYDGSDRKASFEVAGKTQTLGVVLETKGRYYQEELYSNEYSGLAIWNTNCEYKTMHLTIGHMGDTQAGCELEVYLDGVYSQTIDLPWAAAPKTVSIPLNAAPNVRLELVPGEEVSEHRGYEYLTSQYGIYNISFS